MDNPEPRAQYLNVVLRQIEKTALRIPRFQREFVWGQKDVLELLESIQKGYPIGSVLTWKVDQSDDYFSGFREVTFPQADAAVTSFEVILDGAQRLSTLYGCLRAPSTDRVYGVSYNLRTKSFLPSGEVVGDEVHYVPMDAVFDSRKFLAIQARVAELADGEELLHGTLDLYSTFQDYQVPIIALANASLEEVVEVFRRVNSTGTPLSPVDFVRALTWRSSFDLQETFGEFGDRYQGTPLEGLDEDFLIKCLAIVSGLSLDARDVVRLKERADQQGGLTDEVDSMRTALDKMAVLLERFEIRGIREVPYEIQRLILFGLMHYDLEVADAKIDDWFWRSTLAEEHQSKPESYITRLVREMRGQDAEPALVVRRPVDHDLFATRVRRGGSAVATGFDLLLRRSGVRSLISGEPVSGMEPLHGLLFSRRRLQGDLAQALPSAQLLANLVHLSPSDATEWKTLRARDLPLEEMYEACERRTGAAGEIWMSQGLAPPFSASSASVLQERSRTLIDGVLPPARDLARPNDSV